MSTNISELRKISIVNTLQLLQLKVQTASAVIRNEVNV